MQNIGVLKQVGDAVKRCFRQLVSSDAAKRCFRQVGDATKRCF